MSGADFLDSNVLVYLFDPTDARRRGIAEHLVSRAHHEGTAIVSFQVVQETLNVLTRKLKPAMSREDARLALQSVLAPLCRVQPSLALYTHALDLQERYKFSFYDSLIVAAALEAGCARLLSEDLQHGQRIDGLTIKNPFRP